MKYKVMLWYNAGGVDNDYNLAAFTFYTFNQAHLCAVEWAAIDSYHQARLWDGATWRSY